MAVSHRLAPNGSAALSAEASTASRSRGTGRTFLEKYQSAAEKHESLLCVGLDPDPELMPRQFQEREDSDRTADFLLEIVDATKDLVCAYKPNPPFFEAEGKDGFAALERVIREILPTGVPVILDSKRADIPNTSKFFAISAFDRFSADAIVVNPYLGQDALEPFFEREERHTFVLCRTTNEGAAEFQDLQVGSSGLSLYEAVAKRAAAWNTRGNVGLVVAATDAQAAVRVRQLCPNQLFLMPGVGRQLEPQHGKLEAVVAGAIDQDRSGLILNVSRDVLYGRGEAERLDRQRDLRGAARGAAERFRERINLAVEQAPNLEEASA